MKTLNTDVLRMVISFLRRPLPPPNGRNERSSIHQHDLAVAMRVSKEFNNLAAPYLYTVVVTDNLQSLIDGLYASPSTYIRGIRYHKRRLLSLMKRLFLEYSDKSSPSYVPLMTGQAFFEDVDYVNVTDEADRLKRLCWEEVKSIQYSASRLISTKLVTLLTLSTGAFLSDRADIWAPVLADVQGDDAPAHPVRNNNQLERTRVAVISLIRPTARAAGCSTIEICQRILLGPLGYPHTLYNSDPGKRGDPIDLRSDPDYQIERRWRDIQHHIHLDLDHHTTPRLTLNVPIALAGISKWFCTTASPSNESSTDALEHGIGLHLWMRRDYRRQAIERRKIAKAIVDVGKEVNQKHPEIADRVSIDIYLPRTEMRSAESIEETLEHSADAVIETAITKGYKRMGEEKPLDWREQWRVRSIEEAPKCKACDWTLEDEAGY